MTVGGERSAVQNPFVRYAVEAGWTYLSQDEAMNLRRGGITSPVLDSVLIDSLQRLNPGIIDAAKAEETARKIVRVRPSIEGNLDVWEYLKGLKTVFVASEKRERNIRLLDPLDTGANRFHVTDEFTFSNGTPPNIRADIVFFINGVPVILVETKKATALEGIAEALDDIRYYHRKAPEFLALNQLHTLTHLIQFYYGATWILSRKWLFNWREESVPDGDFETLCKTFAAPRRVLRVITDFILFTRKDDELSKVVLRPHQMRAVDRCIGRAREDAKRRGLIWHTQGSGKTYTMITTAKRILEDKELENPTVIMLVDRNELEEQLFKNLEQVGFGSVAVAERKSHLRKLLENDRRGLIVSMIHKFDKISANVNTRGNIFVLVDEAHRTTGGDLGNYLMGAIPNATYIGFTGTPIDRTAHGKGTFKVFGLEDERGYLDKYSIRESIEDGTTVPIHYALAPNALQVDRETLEREFLSLAELEGVSDFDVLNKVLEEAVTLKNMLKNGDRIENVARFTAEHYLSTVEPMGYKAFLVTVDREACCLYKEALDKFLPPEYSRVVISGGGKKDSELLKRHYLSGDEEKDIRKKFRKAGELPKILIVTEKLLTGFDAPVLYCMYLDKPMRDHVLLQAIARVNRPYEDSESHGKPAGFVLDFVGIFDNLEKALAFDSQDVSGVVEGVDLLKEHFEDMINQAREIYLPIIAGKKADKKVEAVLEHFRDKGVRHGFYSFFKELQDVYEILSPDTFLRPFMGDYGLLTDMYYTLRANYDRDITIDREFQRKTARLVQEHTSSGAIQSPDEGYVIDDNTLKKISDDDTPDTVKVFNLLKAIHGLVKANAAAQPYLISIGEKAEAIARAFEERQRTTQELIEALRRLIEEIVEARKSQDETGLPPEAFAVYWKLKDLGIADPRKLAEEAADTFEKFPHWHRSEKQEQDVRKKLYKSLLDAGVNGLKDVVDALFKMLKRDNQ